MNGRALPPGWSGNEGYAHVYPVHQRRRAGEANPQEGAGARPSLPLPAEASDPKHGAQVFQEVCAVCHQANGQGLRWGPGGSGTNGIAINFRRCGDQTAITTARAWPGRLPPRRNFVRANMPKATEYDHPALSARDAFDGAVFVDSQQRPHREGNEPDFPDRALEAGRRDLSALPGTFSAYATSGPDRGSRSSSGRKTTAQASLRSGSADYRSDRGIVPQIVYAKACRADLLPFETGWATELRNRKSSIFPVRRLDRCANVRLSNALI